MEYCTSEATIPVALALNFPQLASTKLDAVDSLEMASTIGAWIISNCANFDHQARLCLRSDS